MDPVPLFLTGRDRRSPRPLGTNPTPTLTAAAPIGRTRHGTDPTPCEFCGQVGPLTFIRELADLGTASWPPATVGWPWSDNPDELGAYRPTVHVPATRRVA
jgi:hypothetical protein